MAAHKVFVSAVHRVRDERRGGGRTSGLYGDLVLTRMLIIALTVFNSLFLICFTKVFNNNTYE